jgi:hypothetical protein
VNDRSTALKILSDHEQLLNELSELDAEEAPARAVFAKITGL